MHTKKSNKRSSIFDIVLITVIFSVALIIIFNNLNFSSKDASNVNQGNINSTKDEKTFYPLTTIEESKSLYENINIYSEVSNDPNIQFSIQYPITKHEEFNAIIREEVEKEKLAYIEKMKPSKTNRKASGELNITFKVFPYDDCYYSFLLHKKLDLPGKNPSYDVSTYVVNMQSGELIDFATIVHSDEQSLKTLSSIIQSSIEQSAQYEKVREQLKNESKASTIDSFKHFILSDDHLYLFFDQETGSEPIKVAIPLTALSSILSKPFQQVVDKQAPAVDYSNKKLIALTFDDGPHPNTTPLVLETLKKYNAKATFFMLGNMVSKYPDLAKQVYEEGHELGNHTMNHLNLTKLTKDEIYYEYNSTEQAIIQATGHPSTAFRPPYGSTNDLVKAVIPKTFHRWTVDTMDWKDRNSDQLIANIKKDAHPNAIVLMHDIHPSTAEGLDAVLQYLQSEGYTFVTLSELVNSQQ